MKVEVVCFGAMRDFLPEPKRGRTHLMVPDGATVRDVVGALGAPAHLVFAVLVDGERADFDRPLDPNVEVTLMPPFAGGAR